MKIDNIEIDSNRNAYRKFKISGTVTKKWWDSLDVKEITLEEFEKKTFNYKQLHNITDIVSQYFRVDKSSLFLFGKERRRSDVRKVCFFFFDKYTNCGYTLRQYADFFNLRHHATILHHLKDVDFRMKNNRAFRWDIEQIDKLIVKYGVDK